MEKHKYPKCTAYCFPRLNTLVEPAFVLRNPGFLKAQEPLPTSPTPAPVPSLVTAFHKVTTIFTLSPPISFLSFWILNKWNSVFFVSGFFHSTSLGYSLMLLYVIAFVHFPCCVIFYCVTIWFIYSTAGDVWVVSGWDYYK